MALRGKGMLVVFTGVKAAHERDLNEWYNREHIDERVNLPGFHRARRYVAVKGSPKYLATYECDSAEDLATPGYLHLLPNQTPWSQRVTGRFTHFTRMTLRVQLDLTHGEGGALTTVRFAPNPAMRRTLVDWLNKALPAVIAKPGMFTRSSMCSRLYHSLKSRSSRGFTSLITTSIPLPRSAMALV